LPASSSLPDAALAWARANLFNSTANGIVTIVIVACFLWVVPKLVSWALTDAVFRPDAEACRAAHGACWGFVAEKFRLIVFGTYPYDQQWRPLLMMALLIALVAATLNTALWGRWLWSAWVVGVPTMWILMRGGDIHVPWRWLPVAVLVLSCLVWRTRIDWSRAAVRIGLAIGAIVLLWMTWRMAWPPLEIPTGLARVETEKWGGLPLTLILSVNGIVLSFPLAVLLALGRRSDLPVVKALSIVFIELVRGVPLITVLFMARLMIPLFLPEGVTLDNLLRAQVGFILFAAAYVAEVIRGGLQAIPRGQYEAADALGLGYWRKTGLIVLPQALKLVIPPLVNTFIGLFKDTSLVVIISMFDLLGAVRLAASDADWRQFYVEGLIFAALVYFAFCYAMAAYSRYLERRLDTSRR
jgi:general L-amino acid transport system permease protein